MANIRKYQDNDIEGVLKVWLAGFRFAHPFLEESFVQKCVIDMRNIYIPLTKSTTWVCVEKKEGKEEGREEEVVVGFIAMIENEIGGLFVSPDRHGRGIGTKLVKTVEEEGGEGGKGMDRLEVEVFKRNEVGRPFYKKYGFEFMKEYYHEESKQDMLRLVYEKKKEEK